MNTTTVTPASRPPDGPTLACPACRHAPLSMSAQGDFGCAACGSAFPRDGGIADFRSVDGDAPFPGETAIRAGTLPGALLRSLVRRIRALRRVRGRLRLLDLGMALTDISGFTAAAGELADIVDSYVGVSPAARGPGWHPGHGARMTKLRAYGERLPLDRENFDLVISLTAGQGPRDPAKGLDEVRRVIADDGLFLVFLNNRQAWFRRSALPRPDGTNGTRQGRSWTPGEFRTLLTRHGFRVTESRGYGYLALSELVVPAGTLARRVVAPLLRAGDAAGNLIRPDAGGGFAILCRPAA